MDVLLDLLKVSGPEIANLHEECLRVLGRLGALDPYQYREISNRNKINFALDRDSPQENHLDSLVLSKNSKSSGDTSKGVMKGTESLRINEMLAKDNKCPDEKFNIRVAVDCIVKKFRANDNLTLPLSTCETIIQEWVVFVNLPIRSFNLIFRYSKNHRKYRNCYKVQKRLLYKLQVRISISSDFFCVYNLYSRICQVGRLSNGTILPKIVLIGQFCFFGVCLFRFFENFGRLTVLVMLN